jgi:hypothetical protein
VLAVALRLRALTLPSLILGALASLGCSALTEPNEIAIITAETLPAAQAPAAPALPPPGGAPRPAPVQSGGG